MTEAILPRTETPVKEVEIHQEHEPVKAAGEQVTSDPVHVVNEEQRQ